MEVEFIGSPGTGKSRICSGLSGLISRQPAGGSFSLFPPVDFEPRLRVLGKKLLRSSLYVALNPIEALKFVAMVRKTRQESPREAFKKTLNLFAEIGRVMWHRKKISIAEQGVLQAIWSLAIGARSTDISGLIAFAAPYLPDIVVHVETERNELHRRLENRPSGRSRLDMKSLEVRERLLSKSDHLFSDIIEKWSRLRIRKHYLKVENPATCDPEKLVSQVHDALESAIPDLIPHT